MAKAEQIDKNDKNDRRDRMVDRILFAGFGLIIVVLILVGLFAMNVGGVKDSLVTRIVANITEEQEALAEDPELLRQLQEREAVVRNETERLTVKENRLKERESLLQLQEEDLIRRQEELGTLEEDIYGVSGNITEITEVIEKMDDEGAAELLSNMQDKDLVRNIVFMLKEDKAASILENLSPQLAAEITAERFSSGVQE